MSDLNIQIRFCLEFRDLFHQALISYSLDLAVVKMFRSLVSTKEVVDRSSPHMFHLFLAAAQLEVPSVWTLGSAALTARIEATREAP